MQTYAEQKAAFEARLKANGDRQKAIMDAAATDGRTLDASEQEEFDTLVEDDKQIAKHIGRLDALIAREEADKKTAKAVDGKSSENGSTTRGGEPIIIKTQPKLEPGIAFARLVKCLGMGQGLVGEAARVAAGRYGEDSDTFGTLKSFAERGAKLAFEGFVAKANVVAGSAASGSWAENLVGDETSAFADFVEYLRPQTIVGKFGAGGIPSLRRVPFRVALVTQTAKGEGHWVGEGKPKPLTSMNFSRTTLTPLKVANIAVLTEEIIRDSSPSAEMIVRDELVAALRERIDEDFIDPTNAGSANVKPASITNGADAIAASAGGDADDIRLDIRSLIQKFINANNPASQLVLIMRSGDALALSLMVNALGQPEFSGIGMNGGILLGVPVITSEYVPSGYVVAVNASDIYFADEGGFEVDMSREASLQMLDNPTNDVVTPTATSLVSLWQTNSVGFRAERALNWARRRAEAVAYLTGVAWGGAVNT